MENFYEINARLFKVLYDEIKNLDKAMKTDFKFYY